MESHNVDNSSDNTSSKPTKRSMSSTSAKAIRHDDCNSFAKPRKRPRHHFWRNSCSLDTLILFGDALLTLTPCLFLILSFLTLSANNQPISLPRGQIVEQVTKLGLILFSIIFAAIVRRLMRTYALWRAKRGVSLSILKQLHGAQNVLTALERAILLPDLDFLSIVIVLLWALSPLEKQSALRVLDRKSLTSFSVITLYYFNTIGSETAISEDFSSASSNSFTRSTLNAIFQASLVSINRVKDSDLWSNIKIPVLQFMWPVRAKMIDTISTKTCMNRPIRPWPNWLWADWRLMWRRPSRWNPSISTWHAWSPSFSTWRAVWPARTTERNSTSE